MVKEIKRNHWSKFCRKFSSDNKYRHMNIDFSGKAEPDARVSGDFPFMGLTLEKRGRLIDGIKLHAGWPGPDQVTHPIISIKQPASVILEKDKSGIDRRLKVRTKEGSETTVDLHGGDDEDRYRIFVEKVAYSIFEHRGGSHGDDIHDWLEAEKKIRKAEAQFV